MSDLVYPEFPRRTFLLAGVVALVLVAAALVVNLRGPSAARCATAVRQELARHGQVGTVPPRACHGLSTRQAADVLTAVYRAEFGRYLHGTPITGDLPPAAYRAASARADAGTLSRARD